MSNIYYSFKLFISTYSRGTARAVVEMNKSLNEQQLKGDQFN